MMSRVAEFFELLNTALAAPTARLFIVAGLVFLGVAIVGNITGRIQPGALGRILGGLVGPVLIFSGVTMELASMRVASVQAQPAQVVAPAPTATPTATPTRPPARTATPTPRPSRTPTPTPRSVLDPKLNPPPTPRAEATLDALIDKRNASQEALQDIIRK
jgi:hypothetical protein